MLRRIGPAGAPPVTLQEAMIQLRETNDVEADLIMALIATACATVCDEAGRVVAAETWETADCGFSGLVKLPKSPVLALTSVKYYVAGVLTTAPLTDFRLYQADDYSYVGPIEAASWPAAQSRPDGTIIRFTAGYTVLPLALRQAILMTISHWFNTRETVGASMTEVPRTAEHLISLEKLGWAAA